MRNRASCRIRFNSGYAKWCGVKAEELFAARALRPVRVPDFTTDANFLNYLKPERRAPIYYPGMFQRLRFVTRASSTPVLRPTLNRQR
ncbi:hypothetical protein BN2475_50034 [Paraburkholderia ribeironis]|uniref:Uncharacterized protein n=1 Tax=Paraburkholderia ribeironis TaxID=1247936 RepID=A0A1N7RK69_9BURK|nr:hypothetical protein BN2475_50034 [Paraburkholderia ribeironis]